MMILPTYSTLDAKAENFKLHIVDTIDDWNRIFSELQTAKGIFRGIGSASYKIYNSLQRQIIQNELKGKFSLSNYINNFRRNELLSNYFQVFKIPPSKLSIYSFLQHYGAPTPYLDFTKSFEKALYFAIEKIETSKIHLDNTINDYFSIFFIDNKHLDTLSIPQVISSLKEVKNLILRRFLIMKITQWTQ